MLLPLSNIVSHVLSVIHFSRVEMLGCTRFRSKLFTDAAKSLPVKTFYLVRTKTSN
jgi:hypothetical protein